MLEGIPLTAHELYMREVRQTPQLTSDEEARLLSCLASRKDVQQSLDRLVAGYQPLVIGLAKRFVRHCRGVDLMDLVQDGNEALLHTLEKYDVCLEVVGKLPDNRVCFLQARFFDKRPDVRHHFFNLFRCSRNVE